MGIAELFGDLLASTFSTPEMYAASPAAEDDDSGETPSDEGEEGKEGDGGSDDSEAAQDDEDDHEEGEDEEEEEEEEEPEDLKPKLEEGMMLQLQRTTASAAIANDMISTRMCKLGGLQTVEASLRLVRRESGGLREGREQRSQGGLC